MENFDPAAVSTALTGADVFFVLMGAILVFAMHGGFAFLEVGTVRRKNQVNALVKIMVDFSISTVSYFFVGFMVAYGTTFFLSATILSGNAPGPDGVQFAGSGLDLVKFFFLATFAAAIPAIISGGIAERAKFWPQAMATAVIVGLIYPFFEGLIWNGNYGIQETLEATFGAPFRDFAGSVVVHAVGGWLALGAVLVLGPRLGRYKPGQPAAQGIPPSNIPWLAMGSWMLCIGWFGFNVMTAGSLEGVTGLVAINSLMALVGGVIAAVIVGRNDPGFVHNGALAGLVAVCAGSDIMHPIGSLITGGVAGALFVVTFQLAQNRWKIDDVLGVWPLHGLCGAWGGIAAGIFGSTALGGMGGVALGSQIVGTVMGAGYALILGYVLYGVLNATIGIRLTPEDEERGADLSVHSISAYPEDDLTSRR
ncbi:ammonium transporter [Pyruvatibacter sp.]|uniref:ammonium transporter n=1 Tax=Pyruvatibacter sp. TaxID=1981328 RepID=UPI0032EEA2EA